MTFFGPGDALILVDVQNDFLPGGSLAVPHGDEIVPVLNGYLDLAMARQIPIIATRDWHPTDHSSFRSQGGPWPPHCVAGSTGAELAPSLRLPDSVRVISKAETPAKDAYSGFEETQLEDELRRLDVRRILVGGLATDYCVLQTVTDGLAKGFQVSLLVDAIRPVDVRPGDGLRAVQQMVRLGARPVRLSMMELEDAARCSSH